MKSCFCCNTNFDKEEMTIIAGKYACKSCLQEIEKSMTPFDTKSPTTDEKIDQLLTRVGVCQAILIIFAIVALMQLIASI